ncbi:MAG: zonular occludens toxin domain-containing protein [archaeon]
MTKKRKFSKKRKSNFWKYLGKVLFFIIKIPYYLIKGIIKIIEKISKKSKEDKVKKKRELIMAKYAPFKIIETLEGDYKNWFEKTIESDSRIGIILGARGSGKTAFGVKLLENIYSKHKEKCFAIGFKSEEFPSWIKVVSNISELENDSWVLIDEGGILFSSRSSMSNANKMLSQLILIARHKNINILFISQNSSNLEVNILRQADFLVLKKSSLLQKEFERKIIQKIYSEIQTKFEKYDENKGITYLYSGNFKGFVSNPLPSFWKEGISKSFK